MAYFFCLLFIPSGLQMEKEHVDFKKGIEGFAKDGLHHTETSVKNTLPDNQSMSR